MKRVWNGLRFKTAYTNKCNKPSTWPESSTSYANELNHFYNCFDCHEFSGKVHEILQLAVVDPIRF